MVRRNTVCRCSGRLRQQVSRRERADAAVTDLEHSPHDLISGRREILGEFA